MEFLIKKIRNEFSSRISGELKVSVKKRVICNCFLKFKMQIEFNTKYFLFTMGSAKFVLSSHSTSFAR